MSKDTQIFKFRELEKISQQHLDIIQQYKPTVISDFSSYKTQPLKSAKVEISVVQEDVIQSIFKEDKPLVLIFASAKNPGGGVTRGSIAQEEVISLHSSWYFQVTQHMAISKGFYLEKGDDAINTDKMLYVKNGFMFTDEYHNEISPTEVSFIGATAPNMKGMLQQGQKVDEKKVYQLFSKRIENLLSFSMHQKNDTLIVGAWGCGVFGLSPEKTANLFKENIVKTNFNKKIVFSIIDEKTKNLFEEVLLG